MMALVLQIIGSRGGDDDDEGEEVKEGLGRMWGIL